ncbi:MAG: immunity 17 family protein [Tannerellaceae bacterium]|jgi:hypothetical protein|nr:immunity 17 family protein [Tannerellaceae bacterium]
MRTTEYLVFAMFILTGIVSLTVAIFNFEWFFQSPKTATFVCWFGRNGARIFYGLLGGMLIAAGVLFSLCGYSS